MRLDDIGELRIREMDAAGIDMQVLSETAPAVHELDADKAIPLARRSNDYLYEEISKNPHRFAGFAALPVSDPKAAADELERAVTKLGFKGAMFMGLCQGRFLDDKFFWPIFERARKTRRAGVSASVKTAPGGDRGVFQGVSRADRALARFR